MCNLGLDNLKEFMLPTMGLLGMYQLTDLSQSAVSWGTMLK